MDEFLGRLGIQAVNYAMRCGISLTSTFALKQCSRLLKTVDNKPQHTELEALQKVLNSKIKIVSPALDLIEFKSGRGNVFLGNAAALAKALHRDIVVLGKRLERAAAAEELAQAQIVGLTQTTEERKVELLEIIHDIKNLLVRIDGDIPLLQLAITASGETLSASLPQSISPSRLLQASMCLVIGDTQFSGDPYRPVQIGPSFTLSLYMLFLGHSTAGKAPSKTAKEENDQDTPRGKRTETPYGVGAGERKPIWQEVLHKARVRVCRTPPGWEFHQGRGFAPSSKETVKIIPDVDSAGSSSSLAPSEEDQGEYAYYLEIIEDLDDGRAHEESQACDNAYDGILHAGMKEAIPMYQISKLLYTDSGRILNIGADNNFENSPVLLLKRDPSATAPTKTMTHMAPEEESEEDNSSECSEDEDEQDGVDRQLREESKGWKEAGKEDAPADIDQGHVHWRFPGHLDPEWLALEVFVEDGNDQGESVNDGGDEDEDDDDDDEQDGSDDEDGGTSARPKQRRSVNKHIAEQTQNMSLSSAAPIYHHQPARNASSSGSKDIPMSEILPPRVVQSPYGTVTSSLSLLEMLVRLVSLQQFQQTSHLAIPDHILTFFLEETSATGLCGEARWQAKRAAKQKMGFDPFTDTPTKENTPKH